MAWTADPNFGSTHHSVDAVAPFTTGGGNKVLRFGAGVIYEDSVSASDAAILYEHVNRYRLGDTQMLVGTALRDSSGNMYVAAVTIYGSQWWASLYKYTQSSDIFSLLVMNQSAVLTAIDTIYNIEFRKTVRSLSILIDGVALASYTDSTLSGPFNLAIVGGIVSIAAQSIPKEINNLQFKSL